MSHRENWAKIKDQGGDIDRDIPAFESASVTRL